MSCQLLRIPTLDSFQDSQTTSAPLLDFATPFVTTDAFGAEVVCFCFPGAVKFGHETAVVGESNSSKSSFTGAFVSLEAADRLQSEIEKPGALSDVSKAPVSIRTGSIFQIVSITPDQPVSIQRSIVSPT